MWPTPPNAEDLIAIACDRITLYSANSQQPSSKAPYDIGGGGGGGGGGGWWSGEPEEPKNRLKSGSGRCRGC